MICNLRVVVAITAVVGMLSLAQLVDAQSCGEAEMPACDGACAQGEACVSGDLGCECVSATRPCGFMVGDAPGCFGSCPEGFRVCSDMMVDGELDCVCIPEFTPTPTLSPTSTLTETPTPTETPEPTDTPQPTDTPEPTPTSTSMVVTPTRTPIACVGDCNNDFEVTVDEIVRVVNIALGLSFISTCPEVDSTGDGQVTVDEILQAVNNALNGCT